MPEKRRKSKNNTIEIGGITFRRADVRWEDAYKANKAPIDKLMGSLIGPDHIGSGYTAEIGGYRLILHDYCPTTETVDVTVVPLKPEIKVRLI